MAIGMEQNIDLGQVVANQVLRRADDWWDSIVRYRLWHCTSIQTVSLEEAFSHLAHLSSIKSDAQSLC